MYWYLFCMLLVHRVQTAPDSLSQGRRSSRWECPHTTLGRTGDERGVVHLELGERLWRQGEVAGDQRGRVDWRSHKLCLGVRKWK